MTSGPMPSPGRRRSLWVAMNDASRDEQRDGLLKRGSGLASRAGARERARMTRHHARTACAKAFERKGSRLQERLGHANLAHRRGRAVACRRRRSWPAPTITPARPRRWQAATELFAVLSPDMMKQLTGQHERQASGPSSNKRPAPKKSTTPRSANCATEFERIQVGFVTDAMKEAPPIYAEHFTVAEIAPIDGVLSHADRRQGSA